MSTIAPRLIVVPIPVDSSDRVLLCRMADDRGVFPGQWALPGGGVEPGERLEDAVRREVREELGVDVSTLEPILFRDAVLPKTKPDGTQETLHMVFLVYRCTIDSAEVVLNDEFCEAQWFTQHQLQELPLNDLTLSTLDQAGLLADLR